jgi:hypothetical protein
VITLDFQAYIGAKEEYDSIRIDCVPPINQKITLVNAIPRLMNADPGLVTMKDLPVLSAVVEDMRKYVYSFAKPYK